MPDVESGTRAKSYPPRSVGLATNQVNFHQLYVFHAVATHLSFSRAAEALEITQPAVSIQVQELEKSLGVILFHRRPRKLGITAEGEIVFAYSQQIFSLSSKMIATVQEMRELEPGHLTLGASTTPGESVLPLAVGQFRRLYPGIRVELVISSTRSIIQRILHREIDLGVVGDRGEGQSDDLEMMAYVDDEIVLVASPDHPPSGPQRSNASPGCGARIDRPGGGVGHSPDCPTALPKFGRRTLCWAGVGQQPSREASGWSGGRDRRDLQAGDRGRSQSRYAEILGRGRVCLPPPAYFGAPQGPVFVTCPKSVPAILNRTPTGHTGQLTTINHWPTDLAKTGRVRLKKKINSGIPTMIRRC